MRGRSLLLHGQLPELPCQVGDTLVKLTDPNPKNKRIYKVGERCHLVFDPESVHVL